MRYARIMRPAPSTVAHLPGCLPGRLLACLAPLLVLLGCGEEATPPPPPPCQLNGNFQQTVFTVIGRDRALRETSYGLLLADRGTGEVLCSEYVQGWQDVYPASAIKTLIAVALLRKVDSGAVSLGDSVAISQPNAAAECSQWDCSLYGPGKRVTVKTLLWDMITISNNLATNQLIDVVGKDECNRTADLLGEPSLRIVRKVYDKVNPEPDITSRNSATAAGLVELYREILSGRLGVLRRESRELLVDILVHQRINGSLSGDFPKQVPFYHKTGNTSEVSSDGGFYYLDARAAVVLVALQGFVDFQAMRAVGRATLDLTLHLPRAMTPPAPLASLRPSLAP